jgi:hypothetical protein
MVERIILKRILQNHDVNWNKVAQKKHWDIMQICDKMLILIQCKKNSVFGIRIWTLSINSNTIQSVFSTAYSGKILE